MKNVCLWSDLLKNRDLWCVKYHQNYMLWKQCIAIISSLRLQMYLYVCWMINSSSPSYSRFWSFCVCIYEYTAARKLIDHSRWPVSSTQIASAHQCLHSRCIGNTQNSINWLGVRWYRFTLHQCMTEHRFLLTYNLFCLRMPSRINIFYEEMNNMKITPTLEDNLRTKCTFSPLPRQRGD